jgi:hypothetical protein
MTTNLDIPSQRLHSQHIADSAFKKPLEVVEWLGAMQAQDYPGAKWSIGLRSGCTDAAVEKAIADKTIVRTWPLRGTLHFVSAADIRWMIALIAPRTIAKAARRYKELELDEPSLKRSNDLLHKAVRDGEMQTRTQLLDLLEANGISTKGQRAAYMLQRASLDGLICQGGTERNNPSYMALDESLPKTKSLSHEESVAELAKRYFTSRGPTTLEDFVAWSSLTIKEARAGLEANKSHLVEEKIDQKTYWLSNEARKIKKRSTTLDLLPGFDEYLLGYRDRSAILDPQHADKIVPGGNGMFKNTIVIDGQVVGTWSREIKKNTVTVTPHPFDKLPADQQEAFAEAAQHYADFLKLELKL